MSPVRCELAPRGATFSVSSPGFQLFSENNHYKIGFDSAGGTRGWIRYNVDVADGVHGHIFSAGPAGSQTDLMVIQGNGNVGIGITSPSQKLEVAGSIKLGDSGRIYFPDGSSQGTAAGGGTITGVLPGSGLSGGGYSGNVTLTLDNTVPRTNAVNYYAYNQILNAGIEVWHGSLLHNSLGGDVIEATCTGVGGFCLVLNPYGNLTVSGVVWASDFRKFFGASSALSADNMGPGDVLVIDPSGNGTVTTTNTPYSTLVAGVYATEPPAPQVTASSPEPQIAVANSGLTLCKVADENGPIQPGDLLVTSSTPGFAMHGTDKDRLLGAVIGKAVGSLASGKGAIKILVTLQ